MDKSTILNIIYITVLMTSLVIYYTREHLKQKRQGKPGTKKKNSDGASFIKGLDCLGYFQFTTPELLDELKNEMHDDYENHGELATLEKNNIPACNRLFSADAEELFEEGGIIEILTGLTFAFEVRRLKLDINDHFEEYKNNDGDQWVVVNGRKYIIYDTLEGSSPNWDTATNTLVYLLNKELSQQGSDERFYTISGGNDAKIILLTTALFDYISRSSIRDDFKPQLRLFEH